MAQDTLDLLDALDWKKDVHVVGVSMGGMISLELVLADPQRFSSLVLTSTNAGRSPPQLVTISFLSRVILVKSPEVRLKLIAETLYPTVSFFCYQKGSLFGLFSRLTRAPLPCSFGPGMIENLFVIDAHARASS